MKWRWKSPGTKGHNKSTTAVRVGWIEELYTNRSVKTIVADPLLCRSLIGSAYAAAEDNSSLLTWL